MFKNLIPIFQIVAIIHLTGCAGEKVTALRSSDFNFDWKFSLESGEESVSPDYDDSSWRTLNLPHDWVIENAQDSTFDFWQATGRIPGKGIGWYRKTFNLNPAEDQTVYVIFDGVYNNADFWINGKHLGFHPFGYSPFYFDLTPHLTPDGEGNVLAVKVDHTRYADSRWYTGAGIYRNVKLVKTGKLHVPVWGTFITTPKILEGLAIVNVEISVKNGLNSDENFIVETILFDEGGKRAARKSEQWDVGARNSMKRSMVLELEDPKLWDLENPSLYEAEIRLISEGTTVDRSRTRFGIRSIRFDPDEGFFLNGKNTEIKGVCLHHDGGLAGSAVPKGVWRRRLEILREGGCNAIRSAHNPASSEFLDLCDEMGFLVQDEFFDEWNNPKDKRFNGNERSVNYETQGYAEHFSEWAQRDLTTTMMSHRNHPSIIQWSIGNEIEHTFPRTRLATGYFKNPDYKGNYFYEEPPYSQEEILQALKEYPEQEYYMGEIAADLAKWTRVLDSSRYITANCINPAASHLNGVADVLDIVGYSYRRPLYDYGHRLYPEKCIMGTENVPRWHEWMDVAKRPWISGTFLWTGIDHMGEIRGPWPLNASGTGILDLAGNKRPAWHLYKTLWNEEAHIHMATGSVNELENKGQPMYRIDEQGEVVYAEEGLWERLLWDWHDVREKWDYQTGEMIVVEVYTNCEKAALFLNGKSLGEKKLADHEDRVLKWAVPYSPGTLTAKGYTTERTEMEYVLATEGEAVDIAMKVDRKELHANHYDVAHIEIQLVDDKGVPVRNADREIVFDVDEKLRIIGVDNGSKFNVQKYQSDRLVTDRGRAMLVIQAKGQAGQAAIQIYGEGIEKKSVAISIIDQL